MQCNVLYFKLDHINHCLITGHSASPLIMQHNSSRQKQDSNWHLLTNYHQALKKISTVSIVLHQHKHWGQKVQWLKINHWSTRLDNDAVQRHSFQRSTMTKRKQRALKRQPKKKYGLKFKNPKWRQVRTVCSAQAHDIAAALPFVLAVHLLSFLWNKTK